MSDVIKAFVKRVGNFLPFGLVVLGLKEIPCEHNG